MEWNKWKGKQIGYDKNLKNKKGKSHHLKKNKLPQFMQWLLVNF
jgi:hypothetical protein